jgi:hypothetical protein
MIITKADILNGKNNIQEFEFKKLGGSVKLRPLTSGEMATIDALIKNGGVEKIKTKPLATTTKNRKTPENALDIVIDPIKFAEAQYKADVKTVYFALKHDEDTENWTETDIQEWPAGSVEEVALKVYEISGMENPHQTKEDVTDFPQEK